MSEEPRLRSITSNSEFLMRLSSCLNRLESCLRRKSASISCLVLGIRMRTQQQRMITATMTNRGKEPAKSGIPQQLSFQPMESLLSC